MDTKDGVTLKALAEYLGGEFQGDPSLEIRGISSLEDAGPDEISFAVSQSLADKVADSRACAFILPKGWKAQPVENAIFVKDPYLAYAQTAKLFWEKPFDAKGIDERAVVGPDCQIDSEVTIEAGAVLGANCKIAKKVHIHPGVVLGDNVEIGEGSVLFPNVVVYEGCRIGRRVRIHAGAIIGADGFGYAPGPEGMVKIPQTGIVVIEDDVEIGANTTIDRAAIGETRIGQGTKIDNLVMIAHNVSLGPHCVIVSQVGISGSTKVGAGVMMGGQVGVVGHIQIGDGARIGAKSGVPHSIGPGETVSGIPAMPHLKWLRMVNVLKKLPDLFKELKQLKKRIERLEGDGKG
ncbi:MAG: UDP-3-O-(3-hydroxymyristoyl)glucosamine N-acyltransferase [Thermodesulfobacteria bacterium]|nr:UDP-3-O-(3-hydroxymyristoyl)glucosamine N-acyltransferase [Thermodesulfobacteriota bacterium]